MVIERSEQIELHIQAVKRFKPPHVGQVMRLTDQLMHERYGHYPTRPLRGLHEPKRPRSFAEAVMYFASFQGC